MEKHIITGRWPLKLFMGTCWGMSVVNAYRMWEALALKAVRHHHHWVFLKELQAQMCFFDMTEWKAGVAYQARFSLPDPRLNASLGRHRLEKFEPLPHPDKPGKMKQVMGRYSMQFGRFCVIPRV